MTRDVRRVAVLASGGADSAVLVADQARQGRVVQPIYVRFGLAWETVEEAHLRRFLDALPPVRTKPGRARTRGTARPEGAMDNDSVSPLVVLDLPIADVYGAHWSVSGDDVPDADTPDHAVYLPGRNLLLLAKSSVWCVLHDFDAIALGTLKGNPFGDSSDEFFGLFTSLVDVGMDHRLRVLRPFADLTKVEVLERGRDLPLHHSFSCIDPVGDAHCGRCNKCAERQAAFAASGIDDRTPYTHA